MTVIEQMSGFGRHHHYVLTMLYRTQAGLETGASEDYWRGALRGIESILDELGVEHERFSPLGFMKYEKGEED